MKKLFFWLTLLIFVYGFMEAASWVSYRMLFGEKFSFSRIGELREKTIASLTINVKRSGESTPSHLLHPYYGYILNPNRVEELQREKHLNSVPPFLIDDPINAYGFFGSNSPIQPSDPNKFIVAITGGSVSAYAGAWGRESFLKGLSQIPTFKDREIILIYFSAGAYKQPQQLMVIADILSQGGHIDLLINIDGFNEIALPISHGAFVMGVSPFFPTNWKLRSETSYSRDSMMRLGQIALLQEDRVKWANYLGHFPWRYSLTAATVWRFKDNILIKQKSAREKNLGEKMATKKSGLVLTTADQRTSLGPPHRLKDARELYEASSSLWARSSVLLNNMVASQGGLYVHFLQPNQYFQGSKSMGTEESRIALNPASPYKQEVERGYPYLRSAGKALLRSGIHFYDLTTLFKDDPEPVYRDTCCHFTKEGNEKLVKAIITRVAEAVFQNPLPNTASIVDPDYSPKTLRNLALQPEGYSDGSGVGLKQQGIQLVLVSSVGSIIKAENGRNGRYFVTDLPKGEYKTRFSNGAVGYVVHEGGRWELKATFPEPATNENNTSPNPD